MDFQEAIQKIEERGDFNRYAEVKSVFLEQLRQLKPEDHTQRGLCYYYLLVSYLKAQLVHETEESVDYFEAMDEAFLAQEKEYKEHANRRITEEVKDFYRLMERCYNALEFLYQRHSFGVRRNLAYQRKMEFRKHAFWYKKEYSSALEYTFLDWTCRYGTSIARWALTTLSFVFIVSLAYMAVDRVVPMEQRMIPGSGHWFDYFYFSIIVLTTVGLGDVVPLSVEGKILASAEAFFGFLMLAVFVGMLQKKL